MNVAMWERDVRPHFDFLLQHGFEFDRGSGSSEWYATDVIYRSTAIAVVVTYSVEFGRVEVELVRMIDPRDFPRLAYVPLEERPFNRTLLDDVVEARAPERIEEVHSAAGLNPVAVKEQLERWAALVREVAPDLLEGATTLFEDARRVMERRIAERAAES